MGLIKEHTQNRVYRVFFMVDWQYRTINARFRNSVNDPLNVEIRPAENEIQHSLLGYPATNSKVTTRSHASTY